MEAFQAPGIVGVRDALLDGLPFQLGEHNADVQHGPPHWGGGVELFRGGNKLHVVLLEQLHHVRKIQNGAADPVQLVDDYPPHLPFTDLVKQSLELGPVGVLPRTALVLEKLDFSFHHLLSSYSATSPPPRVYLAMCLTINSSIPLENLMNQMLPY